MKSKVVDRDRGWRDILKASHSMAGGARVRVGILGDSSRGGLHRVDPETGEAEPLTIAEIALVNEYGNEDGTIPARPAHTMTFDMRKEEIFREARNGLVSVTLDRKLTPEQLLNAMGMRHAAAIRNTITAGAGVPPPNAPATLREKRGAGEWNREGKAQAAGFDARTLVDTGATVNAISWAVEIGNDKRPPEYLTGGKGKE